MLPWFFRQGQKLLFGHGGAAYNRECGQDNVHPHTAKESGEALKSLWGGDCVLVWPVNSSDLNPVENLWALPETGPKVDAVRGQIDPVEKPQSTLEDLCKQWDRQYFANMLLGMLDRCPHATSTLSSNKPRIFSAGFRSEELVGQTNTRFSPHGDTSCPMPP